MGDELKTAYELAMERLRAADEKAPVPLSDEARRQIAEIRSEYEAKRAEASILAAARAAAAGAAGDEERVEQVEEEYRREAARLAAEEESRVSSVRTGGSPPSR